MADKTTTLKTKTNDNVYPNIIGENRKDSFVDSSTITHHFYDQTHKVGFQIANEINIKIQNSLQNPTGLTKTKLVGVGTNGQENIEIGDNLTLANGKLSATGGGGGSSDVNFIEANDDFSAFTGDIKPDKVNVLKFPENSGTVVLSNVGSDTYSSSVQFTQEDNGYTYIVDYIISADSTTKAVTMNPQAIWVNTPDTRSTLISNAVTLANALTFYKHSITMSSKDSYFVSFSFDCPKDILLTSVSAIAYSSKREVRLSANGYVYRDNKEFPVVYVVLKTNHSIGINYLSDKNTISELIITESTVNDFAYNYSTLN